MSRALGLNRANLDNKGTDILHFLPLAPAAGKPIAVKGSKRNTGLLDALQLRSATVIQLYDGRTDIGAFCDALEQRLHDEAESHPVQMTVPAGAEYVVTAQGPSLSEDDVNQIHNDAVGVYVAGAYSYSDEEHNGQPRYNWHYRAVLAGKFPPCKGGPQGWNLDWSNVP